MFMPVMAWNMATNATTVLTARATVRATRYSGFCVNMAPPVGSFRGGYRRGVCWEPHRARLDLVGLDRGGWGGAGHALHCLPGAAVAVTAVGATGAVGVATCLTVIFFASGTVAAFLEVGAGAAFALEAAAGLDTTGAVFFTAGPVALFFVFFCCNC